MPTNTSRDDPTAILAARVKRERDQREWSLADLAERSGVSKAMLSKIERAEVSATVVVVMRIAGALQLTLAELLVAPKTLPTRKLKHAEQPTWRDPKSRYLRRQIFLSADHPMELVEVTLPANASVPFPASSYRTIRQVVWVLEGELTISEGRVSTTLARGDRLEFGAPSNVLFDNSSRRACRYLVALVREQHR